MSSACRSRCTALAAVALLAGAGSAGALERIARPAPDAHDSWSRGSTCTIAYYNFCTGWIWTWSNWAPGERVGTVFSITCGNILTTNWIYVPEAVPSGYGFTGSIGAIHADANLCPVGSPVQSQPFLPVMGWNIFGWTESVGGRFAVVVEMGPAPGSPLGLGSDHPAPTPVGPAACGSCYPLTRTTRSFHWGTSAAPLCPGVPLFDGFCNAELLLDVDMTGAFAVEPVTWGRLKSLYR